MCMNLFAYGCSGSLLLHASFLWLQRAGTALKLRYGGFSLWWRLFLQSTGSSVQAQEWWHTGLLPLGMWNPPDRGLNLCPLPWQMGSQPLDHQGSLDKSFDSFRYFW